MPIDMKSWIHRNGGRHVSFAVFLLLSSLIFLKTLLALVEYSLHNDSSSHIVLIPFLVIFLIFLGRERIFANTGTSLLPGLGIVLVGSFLFVLSQRTPIHQQGIWPFSLATLSIILVWVGGFLLSYGSSALRTAAFALLFLLLIIPLPDVILDHAIRALQEGSTEVAYLIFQVAGTPVARNGLLLSVPGVTIEVAKECSSIRSSIALVITCLLASYLYLRTAWKVLLFVMLSLLLSVVKNGIRIATLTLLSIYVDPGFLSGRLHREGGFAFFLLALVLLWPVFTLLERSDRPRHSAVSSVEAANGHPKNAPENPA
jgi:exosortase